MKPQLLSLLTAGCITMILLGSSLAYATDAGRTEENTVSVALPSHYPDNFQRLGVLTKIRDRHDWLVNGISIKVSQNVLVHSLESKFSSLYSVKQGMELGYRLNSRREISEIWLLPAGTVDLN